MRFSVFNILRGSEFLRTLHLAAVEAFADQALFPSRVLLHPTTLAAFTRIRTLMKFEVVPMMGRPGGAEVITQIKMMPTPSPAMRSKHLPALVVRTLAIGKCNFKLNISSMDTTMLEEYQCFEWKIFWLCLQG